MWFLFRILILVDFEMLVLVIMLGFLVWMVKCFGFLIFIWMEMFLRFRMMLVMFLWMFVIEENLCSMLLIWIVVIVVFCSDDSRMWCSVLLRVRLKLCLSGFVIMVVLCWGLLFGFILSCVGLISFV